MWEEGNDDYFSYLSAELSHSEPEKLAVSHNLVNLQVTKWTKDPVLTNQISECVTPYVATCTNILDKNSDKTKSLF